MIQKDKHVDFIIRTMKDRDILYYITEQDRMATVYWAVNSLKMLKDPIFEQIKLQVIHFVFSSLKSDGGFGPNPEYSSNVVSTFNALQILFLYDMPYYDIKTIEFIKKLQRPDGAFTFDLYGDIDTRYDCCAILSIHLLAIMKNFEHFDIESATKAYNPSIKFDQLFNNGTQLNISLVNNEKLDRKKLSLPINTSFLHEIGFDIDLTLNHLLGCFNYDGGVGQIKGAESHAAQVFCVLSSLRSLGHLESIDKLQTIDFLINRQLPNGGLCGRVNKKEDVCYSFWALSAMLILEAGYIDFEKLRSFILSCEGIDGGFGDRPGNMTDIYHLMFSLASLSLLDDEKTNRIDPGFAL